MTRLAYYDVEPTNRRNCIYYVMVFFAWNGAATDVWFQQLLPTIVTADAPLNVKIALALVVHALP
jgi:hypothetical protein